MPGPDLLPTLDAPDDDPYLWLEDIEGSRALAWVESQNAATLKLFGQTQIEADRILLKTIFDRPDNIPYPTRIGGQLFNLWQDASNPRGLWRTTTLESFRDKTPDWDVLLDLDAYASRDNEDWILKGTSILPGAHNRVILSLSRGGADAVVLREFDMSTRDFVPDGFNLAEGHSSIVWLDRDTLLLMSAIGPGMATKSGYARTVRRWQRGTDPQVAPIIFETQPDSILVYAGVDRSSSEERLWFVEKPGIIEAGIWIGDRTGPTMRIDVPGDAWVSWHRGWLAVKPRTPWHLADKTFGTDSVIGMSFSAFLSGERHFTTLFEPGGRRALQSFFWCGGRLLLSILDDLKPVFEVHIPADGTWSRTFISGLPDLGTVYVWPFDAEEQESTGDLLASAQDPLTPPTLLIVEPAAAPAVLKQTPHGFDPAGLVTTRHEAISSDGTRIPYVQVGPPGQSGDAPVHLYGYGGFNISMPPFYNAAIGKLWLERGGTSVIAHLRGGREFGNEWYEAARRAGRRLAHDDFAAVAADLVDRGVTRPGRIAAEGGSNGGLLIANMLTRYPDRFGALLCTVPVIDMRRYTKLLMGVACVDEYGDPDKPDDWQFLAPMSAYHVASPGKNYPPIMLVTSRRDDRVHPGHARKMAAKLQAMNYKAHFYEPAAGGHSAGKNHDDQAALIALELAFLRRAIGW